MLTDAHCHPTIELNADVGDVQMCVMSAELSDLEVVAEFAEKYPLATPAFGVHPWFSHTLKLKNNISKLEHYQSVLDPKPQLDADVLELPEPVFLDEYITKLKQFLKPNGVLGEVGLDKVFVLFGSNGKKWKVSFEHQLAVLRAQLLLANDLNCAVSLHGVHCPQPLFDTVKEFKNIRVCLHSYGGSAEFFKNAWMRLDVPCYVSISTLVNGRSPKRLAKLLEVAKPEQLLSESDFHSAGERQRELINESLKLLQPKVSAEQVTRNYRRFIALS